VDRCPAMHKINIIIYEVYKGQHPVWIAQSLYKKVVKIPDLLYVCKNSVVTDRILIVVNLAVKANTYVYVIVTKH
jgi:hypothetical protein